VSGEHDIVQVNLESMTITTTVALPARVADLVAPRGDRLVAALPSLQRLAVLDMLTGLVTQSDLLPGPVDLLAASRDDGRVVAAGKGGHWVAIADSETGSIQTGTVGGTVTSIALDSRSGVAVVATAGPDRLLGLDLATLANIWSWDSAEQPTGIAVGVDKVFIAAGHGLWEVGRDALTASASVTVASPTVRRWASLAREATALAISDDGTLVYAMESDRIEGFHSRDASTSGSTTATAARTVLLAGSRAPLNIATVPGAQPMLGGPENGALPANGSSLASNGVGLGSPPPTDTLVGVVSWQIGPDSIAPVFLIVALIVVIGWGLVQRRDSAGRVATRRPTGGVRR
jgi:hypothetical protein